MNDVLLLLLDLFCIISKRLTCGEIKAYLDEKYTFVILFWQGVWLKIILPFYIFSTDLY